MKSPFVQCECACVYGENIYFFSELSNNLNCLNSVTLKVNVLGSVPWEDVTTSRLYTWMYNVSERIVLMPFSGRYITVYDLKEKKFEKIGPCMQPYQISASILLNSKIYMLISSGCEKDGIYSLDINKKELKLEQQIADIYGIGSERIWTSYISEMRGKLYFGIGETNKFMLFDPQKRKIELYTMPGNLKKCYGLICGGGILFSIDAYSKNGILFSENMEIIKEYKFNENIKYYNLIYDTGIIYIHFLNSEITYEIYIQKDDNYYIKSSSLFVGKGTLLNTEFGVTLLPTKDNGRFIFKERNIEIVDIEIPYNYLQEVIKGKKIIDEKNFPLDRYIDIINHK